MHQSVAADLASPLPDVRIDAVRLAADSGEPWARDVLLDALDDRDPEVVSSAAWALGDFGDPSAAPVLVELLDERELRVRVAAARALGVVGDASAASRLMELAADPDCDRWLRSVARESLESLGYEGTYDKPPGLIVWALGAALVVTGVAAAALWGAGGVVPFAIGLALLVVYQLGQLRRAAAEGWVWRESDGGSP